jgi:hypothetical protein
VWSDRQTNRTMLKKAENRHGGHRGSDSQFQVEMGRPCGKNGPAVTGTRYINVGHTHTQKEQRGDRRSDEQTRSKV